jgi:hypothetical protein
LRMHHSDLFLLFHVMSSLVCISAFVSSCKNISHIELGAHLALV